MKNLHKFFNRHDIPWVNLIWERHYSNGSLPSTSNLKGSFWWKDILKLLDSFKGLASANVKDGVTCLFWDDLWLGKVTRIHYPQLFSFARLPDMSINMALSAEGTESLFHFPLSQLAAQQLVEIAENLNSLSDTDEKDIWTYIWGSPFFSTSKAYSHLTGHLQVHPLFHKLWKSSCQNKHKVFFWLLLRDRLSTRELLRRRNMHLPSYDCACCTLDVEETLSHLFLICPFAQACWIKLNVIVEMDPFLAFEEIKTQLQVPFYMDIIVLSYWSIWMQRNDLIFKGIPPSSDRCLHNFRKEFALVILRAKTRWKAFMTEWIETLV